MLIGRDSERQALGRLAAAARVAESGCLVLVGEPGLGKTALLDDVASRAEGLRVLRVRGSETERDLAFGGLDQLLHPLLGLLGQIPAPQARALEIALALRPGERTDRFAVSAATLSLLSRAAEDEPLLILVDDAHVLDVPSVEALVFTCRRVLADPIACLVASRPEGTILAGGLPRRDLCGLRPDEVTELLAEHAHRHVPTALGRRVHAATGGNPLAVVELAEAIDELEQEDDDVPVAVPDRVVVSYGQRLAGLPASTREALLVASVAGDVGESILAARELGIGAEELRPAEAAGLVTLVAGGVTFKHPLMRASAFAAATPVQRRAAHRAVAAVTRVPERRAWHLGQATVGLDDEVADLIATSAEHSLARGAHSVAASGYERSAALTTKRPVRAARLLAAGRAAILAGHGQRAAALLDRAAVETGETLARGYIDAARASVELRWGSLERSRELGVHALGALASADPRAAVEAAADLVTTCFYLGDTGVAGHASDTLEQLSGAVEGAADGLALLSSGVARVIAGREGMPLIRAGSAVLAADHADTDKDTRPSWLLVGPLFLREESPATRELAERAEARLRKRSAIGPLASFLFHSARYAASTERWADADAYYHEGIALARETGQTIDLTLLLAGLAWLESRTGADQPCREHAAEALALADRHHVHLARIWALYGLGDLDLGRGRPLEALEALEHYDRLQLFLDRTGFRDVDVCPAPEQIECLQRSGDRSIARRLAEDYRARATAKGQPWARARAERASALVATDPRPGLSRAMALHATSQDIFEEARTQLLLGEAARRRARRTAARGPLRSALAVFDRLGAAPWAERATAELAATGERLHRRRDLSIEQLTPQERQVATLLGGGRTTRQAAEAMFLSPKTVEYHLRHVYTKLAINNRSDLADAVADGLTR